MLFATGSATVLPESKPELEKLRQLLEDNPGLRIRLQGHTDNVGSEADNLELSSRRAEAVRDFLVEAGIAAGRLEAKGFGESRPLTSNDTDAGRALNRRTEFLVL